MPDEPRFPVDASLARLQADLGLRRLDKLWAKLEIVLGLFAASVGLLVGVWAVTRPEADFGFAAVAVATLTLGGYLALAGSRSHLYQSGNQLTAYLAELVRRSNTKADS